MESEMTYSCACGATKVQHYDAGDDPPEGWWRLEDNASVFVACSLRCLKAIIALYESPEASDAVDPHASK